MTNESSANKVAFFIARIGTEGSDIRFASDLVLNLIVKPAARKAGLDDAQRADEIDLPGRITDTVINRIADGPAVIADLTGRNPNVFYEVAIAHAASVPLVQLIEADELASLPFDVDDQNTIQYRADDYSTYIEAAERTAAQLEAAIGGARGSTPIVAARQFKALEQVPQGEGTALVLRELDRIGERLRRLEGEAQYERLGRTFFESRSRDPLATLAYFDPLRAGEAVRRAESELPAQSPAAEERRQQRNEERRQRRLQRSES